MRVGKMNLNQRYSAAASDHATLQYLRRIENGEIMGTIILEVTVFSSVVWGLLRPAQLPPVDFTNLAKQKMPRLPITS